ncbi:MAG: signal recognition particle-docking protein FtsY [Candidatus Limnocylindrus sp.]
MKLAFWRKSTSEEKASISAAAAPSGGGIIQALRRSLAPEPDWSALESALLASDAGSATAGALISAARQVQGGTGRERLRSALLEVMLDASISSASGATAIQHVVLLVGVNGAGKTTSAAKLAARAKAASMQPLLVAADTFRAAAIDQLRLLASREGVPIVEGRTGGDPSAAIHDALTQASAKRFSPVIIDTAGRMQTKSGLMDELTKMRRVIERLAPIAEVEVLLVIDATAGQNGLAQASGFNRAAGVDGVILTKLDAGARGGVALAVRRELGLPIRWVGVGERGRDLLPFDAVAFVEGLLGDAA